MMVNTALQFQEGFVAGFERGRAQAVLEAAAAASAPGGQPVQRNWFQEYMLAVQAETRDLAVRYEVQGQGANTWIPYGRDVQELLAVAAVTPSIDGSMVNVDVDGWKYRVFLGGEMPEICAGIPDVVGWQIRTLTGACRAVRCISEKVAAT